MVTEHVLELTIRNLFSLEKMEYKAKQGMVVYRPKHHAILKPNFQIMSVAAWLKLLLQHVADRGERLVRYYGWYSNRSRGDRIRNEEDETNAVGQLESDPYTNDLVDPEYLNAARFAWARLIKKVYEVAVLSNDMWDLGSRARLNLCPNSVTKWALHLTSLPIHNPSF